MPTGYTRSPKLSKGAFVKLGEGFLGVIPTVIVFQFNPEKFNKQYSSSVASGTGKSLQKVPTVHEPFDPNESFSMTLELDASDAMEIPEVNISTVATGVTDRIAALESLLYPEKDTKGGSAASGGSKKDKVPKKKVSVVLLIWGQGRILPVRITSITVEEQAYSPTLYPIQASVTLQVEVLKPESFFSKDDSPIVGMAMNAYEYTKKMKEKLAGINQLASSGQSILAMLPF